MSAATVARIEAHRDTIDGDELAALLALAAATPADDELLEVAS
jgi:hypothetical protein